MLFNHDERRGHGDRHDQRQQHHHPHQGSRYEPQQQQQHTTTSYPGNRRPYYRAQYGDRAHRSGALQWAVAVVSTVLAVAVLLAAVAVLMVVLLVQPRSPYVAVRAAHLDALVYDQQGALDDVQVSVLVEARNGNAHGAGAGFSDLELRLAFAGTVLARLRADAFAVPPRGALPLAYVARARGPAPLGEPGSAAMEAGIRAGVVPFSLEGEARTRWKLAGVVHVRQWTRLACQIPFAWPNGTALDFSCRSKSKSWFF